MTRWYLDTEFLDDGKTIDLISLALVSEEGKEFYAASTDFDSGRIVPGSWLDVNVMDRLRLPNEHEPIWMTRKQMAREIKELLLPLGRATVPSPQVWAYFADYDWIVLCQLFGAMLDLPKGLPHLCLDIAQEMIRLDIDDDHPHLPQQDPKTKHNALADARHDRVLHDAVVNIERARLLPIRK